MNLAPYAEIYPICRRSGLIVRESCIHWAALISTSRLSVITLFAESATFTSGVLVGTGVEVGGLRIAVTVAPISTPLCVPAAGAVAWAWGVASGVAAAGSAVGVGGVSTSVIDTMSGVGVAAAGATGVAVGLVPRSHPVANTPSTIHRATKARTLLKTQTPFLKPQACETNYNL